MREALRVHWPEYLMEAWGLGTFMISAGAFVTLIEYPGSPVQQAIADPDIRRALIGLAMGLTAIGIIYSPWGQRSGAHINPSVTLTFLRLGKVAPWDAAFYIIAQFIGGTLGVLGMALVLDSTFTGPPVAYVATVPGPTGVWVAFVAELLISMGLMLMVLFVSNTERIARFTGLGAGCLVALYITVEAPFSGMSMNPVRTFASAAAGGSWTHAWIYYTAPLLGMLAAVEVYQRVRPRPIVKCAKLDHPAHVRCIHCGY
jgi:aquaporin Z